MGLKGLDKDFDKSEDDIKALQSVGQVIGEVLKQLDEERCEYLPTTIWSSNSNSLLMVLLL
jgi:ATP-dependent 26S proteasome regulatory subunit